MNRIGLALSGGGFRATLYHLGVIRCLKDMGVLPKVAHITAVSGGSVVGAHLVLNWDRYCGSAEQFNEAAEEVIRFTQLDVRNRIVRRFPFLEAANRARSIMLLKNRREWTRAGILENYYERFLFGDTPLSALPKAPRLHILSTNLSEGSICAFHRNGMLLQQRTAGRRDQFVRVEAGLATVPMAVAASSCFPGFFPPMELSSWDVGAEIGAFTRVAFTDGGVYDNLGLRMLSHLQQASLRQDAPLNRNDFLALDDTVAALVAAGDLPAKTPIRQLRALIDDHVPNLSSAWKQEPSSEEASSMMILGLWEVIRSEHLYRDPVLANLELDDPSAQSLLVYLKQARREPEVGDRLWLNRMMVDAILSQVVGKPCLRPGRETLDGTLVSDAGGKFKVTRSARGGGLIKTALRSSDILMDRVWQLESEHFENSPGVVFAPINEVVTPGPNQRLLSPQAQRQVPNIRTDLDYFSDLEVSALTQHGYGVTQQVCRRHATIFQPENDGKDPWDPRGDSQAERDAAHDRRHGSVDLGVARRLQHSAKRKVVSRLLDWHDWPSYLWLALLSVVLIGFPYLFLERNERLRQQATVLAAVAELDPNYQRIVELLRVDTPVKVQGMEYSEVSELPEPDWSGVEVVSESRVFDLRGWSESTAWQGVAYNRTRVLRLPNEEGDATVRLQRVMSADELALECRSDRLSPKLSRMQLPDNQYQWQLELDLNHVPIDGHTEIVTRTLLPEEMAASFPLEGRFSFTVRLKTGLVQVWILMPKDRQYGAFEVSSHPIGHPELSEIVVPAATVRIALESVVTFRLINPEPNRQYECRWRWEE